MSTRFAGDFFGVPLAPSTKNKDSSLVGYFPELRVPAGMPQRKTVASASDTKKRTGATNTAGLFYGFKTSGKTNEFKATPVFGGFKTFEG